MKRKITESQINRAVRNSIKRALNEASLTPFPYRVYKEVDELKKDGDRFLYWMAMEHQDIVDEYLDNVSLKKIAGSMKIR
jgi:hypothetical protein